VWTRSHHDLGPEQRHEPAGDDHHRGVPRCGRHPLLHAVINDLGLVTLEIEQEVSDVNTLTKGENPTFFKRSITTNLVASQDQSIVLGGLVKERKSLDRSGLRGSTRSRHRVDLRSRTDSVSRNELLIFITPRVIRSVEEGSSSAVTSRSGGAAEGPMKESQGFRLKVDRVLPVPDPASNIPPAKAPRRSKGIPGGYRSSPRSASASMAP